MNNYMNVKPIKLNLEGKEVFNRKKGDVKATLLAKGDDRSLFCINYEDKQNITFLKKDYFVDRYENGSLAFN